MTKIRKHSATWWRTMLIIISVASISVGLYILLLLLAPAGYVPFLPKTKIDLDTSDDATDSRDRIQIEKLQLEVGISEGGADSLDRGVWHRWPERGDPVKGGNFILSAHRFRIGKTPIETKINSPFYTLDRLSLGDRMRIYWRGNWYEYQISKIYSVKPDAIEIEAPSENAKLTLYTCSLKGSADGRVVVEAYKI